LPPASSSSNGNAAEPYWKEAMPALRRKRWAAVVALRSATREYSPMATSPAPTRS
jgi:hypothetical protein